MQPDPVEALENSRLHHLLAGSQRLQRLPAIAVCALIALAGLLTGAVWSLRGPNAAFAGLITIGGALLNWLALWLLPRFGLSYGPDRPSALGLLALFTLIGVTLGLLLPALALLLLIDAGLTLLAVYATWVEPRRLTVTEQRLNAGVSLRLLHLADLHLERLTGRETRLNALVQALKPDVIVFTGDFINLSYRGDAQTIAQIRAVLAGWQAPLGVYAVAGTPTVESLADVAEFTAGLPQVQVLNNAWVSLPVTGGMLHLCGLTTTHLLDIDRAALTQLAERMPTTGCRVLLAHSPDIAPEAAAAGFDLVLSGHTHGGQIRLPLIGPLLTASVYGRRFASGRHSIGATTLYTSRGIGMEGLGAPRARLLCPPEIIIWDLGPV